ncbi:hypothetical protein GCM10023075_28170 [Streptosporangium album]
MGGTMRTGPAWLGMTVTLAGTKCALAAMTTMTAMTASACAALTAVFRLDVRRIPYTVSVVPEIRAGV